ncbi:hypothetical protein I5Q34_17195 [Streptomyces sp. AV19]|uniref:hypothetical protein n=1 Tax=Streptomyces sp. AV19 TaxID=2793068 RepID=UPI0018FE8328|nr:hypothetical protein [Streptomyces sp. AV19]MBH1935983.1 hypothetical protein [Streptomyces sp. AV19]MDG4534226.1 hypothetical protein [Streptomyces sp. AV19]
MRRHDFEPGRLVVGLVLLGGGLAYLLEAAGRWHFPAYALLPALVGGLCLGGAVPSIGYLVRRRRGGRGVER